MGRAFQITFDGGGGQSSSSVSISGSEVTATFATTARHGQAVRAWYLQPLDAAERLKDLSGNEVTTAEVQNRSVTNNTPPAFSSAAVDGDELTVTFDGPLDTGSVPAAGDFAVKVGGEAAALADTNPVNVAGSAVTLTLAEAVAGSLQVVTVGYTPGTNPLRDGDRAKHPVTGFGDVKTATNNTPNDGTVPTVSSAQINGGTLTVTFSEALDENSVPAASQFKAGIGGFAHTASSVSVKGATVTLAFTPATHGQPVSVNYSKPTSNPLRDLSGNEVLDFGFITSQTVTNNTPPAFSSAAVSLDSSTGGQSRFNDVEKVFGILMIVTASGMAFAHGSNDVANAIGPVAAIVGVVTTGGVAAKSAVPVWVLLIGAAGIVVGLATFGYRVMATIGRRITELTPSRGFAAEFAAASTVVVASGTGLPVSTTQTLVGAVMGVGLARGDGRPRFRRGPHHLRVLGRDAARRSGARGGVLLSPVGDIHSRRRMMRTRRRISAPAARRGRSAVTGTPMAGPLRPGRRGADGSRAGEPHRHRRPTSVPDRLDAGRRSFARSDAGRDRAGGPGP